MSLKKTTKKLEDMIMVAETMGSKKKAKGLKKALKIAQGIDTIKKFKEADKKQKKEMLKAVVLSRIWKW